MVSCTTTKKRGETSKIGMLYHDVTSKYNRNFNANILLDESVASLETAHQDDYTEILPLYPLVQNEDPTTLYEPMDQAIEKASVAIAIHRPSHWTDDNYMIIGKAQYLKQDYESAEATFRYLIKHYDPKNIMRASQQSNRDRDRKLSEREKAIEKKAQDKEREERIKERRKAVKESKKKSKLAEKKRKARIKDRRQQIKERERLAKQGRKLESKKDANQPKDQIAKNDKQKDDAERKRKETFPDQPKLPKVKGNPDNYFLKHKPAIQEAKLWLARTLIERDRYGEAENIMRTLISDARTFDHIRDEVYVVQAYSALDRGQNAAAVEPLKMAIDRAKRGEQRARYAFVLAQVLEQSRQYAAAQDAYDNVVKMRPSYVMHFNAQLNKTKMQWNTGSVDDQRFDNVINRMIKDDKNREYLDQLHFALAEKELKSGNVALAIDQLRKSVKNSSGNQIQKADSYYKMASLFFESEDFVNAKYYYDSTLTVLQESDDRYEEVSTYAKNLAQIAQHLETITYQDSLLRLSKLTDKELKKLASKIKKERQARQLAAQTASSKPSNIQQATLIPVSRAGGAASTKTSSFFAYDDRALKKGLRDFKRKWGEIALSDDWRRASGNAFNVSSSDDLGEDSLSVAGPISETEVEEIFKDVPKTDIEREAAASKIEDALFELGRLYRSELSNSQKSIEALERMLSMNPESEHCLDAYYLLYVAHTELGQTSQANVYKEKITSEYADSEYAKYINDPAYLENVISEEDKVEQYYTEVYGLYSQGLYKDAYSKLKAAPKAIGTKHMLLSKFSLNTRLILLVTISSFLECHQQ